MGGLLSTEADYAEAFNQSYCQDVTYKHRVLNTDNWTWCTVPESSYDAVFFAAFAVLVVCVAPPKYATLVCLIGGMVYQVFANFWNLGHVSNSVALWMNMSPADVFVYAFFPPLLLDSAVRMDWFMLRKVSWNVLYLAFIMVLGSALLLIPFMLWALDLQKDGWNAVYVALFGTMIGSTDAASCIAILKAGGAPELLSIILEGESLFNDASSLTMFEIFKNIIVQTDGGLGHDVAEIAVQTIIAFAGGVGMGLGMAIFVSLLLRWLQSRGLGGSLEIAVSLAAAYMVYFLTQVYVEASGVVAVAVFGVLGSATMLWGMSKRVLQNGSFFAFWDTFVFIINGIIFFYVGASAANLTLRASEFIDDNPGQGPVDNLSQFFGRMAGYVTAIYLFSFASRFWFAFVSFKVFKLLRFGVTLSTREILFVTVAGLRGSLSLILVQTVIKLAPNVVDEASFVRAEISLWTTAYVILTLVVNAPLLGPMLGWLGLNKISAEAQHINKQVHHMLVQHSEAAIAHLRGNPDELVDGVIWSAVEEHVMHWGSDEHSMGEHDNDNGIHGNIPPKKGSRLSPLIGRRFRAWWSRITLGCAGGFKPAWRRKRDKLAAVTSNSASAMYLASFHMAPSAAPLGTLSEAKADLRKTSMGFKINPADVAAGSELQEPGDGAMNGTDGAAAPNSGKLGAATVVAMGGDYEDSRKPDIQLTQMGKAALASPFAIAVDEAGMGHDAADGAGPWSAGRDGAWDAWEAQVEEYIAEAHDDGVFTFGTAPATQPSATQAPGGCQVEASQRSRTSGQGPQVMGPSANGMLLRGPSLRPRRVSGANLPPPTLLQTGIDNPVWSPAAGPTHTVHFNGNGTLDEDHSGHDAAGGSDTAATDAPQGWQGPQGAQGAPGVQGEEEELPLPPLAGRSSSGGPALPAALGDDAAPAPATAPNASPEGSNSGTGYAPLAAAPEPAQLPATSATPGLGPSCSEDRVLEPPSTATEPPQLPTTMAGPALLPATVSVGSDEQRSNAGLGSGRISRASRPLGLQTYSSDGGSNLKKPSRMIALQPGSVLPAGGAKDKLVLYNSTSGDRAAGTNTGIFLQPVAINTQQPLATTSMGYGASSKERQIGRIMPSGVWGQAQGTASKEREVTQGIKEEDEADAAGMEAMAARHLVDMLLPEYRLRLLTGLRQHFRQRYHEGVISIRSFNVLNFCCNQQLHSGSDKPLNLWAIAECNIQHHWALQVAGHWLFVIRRSLLNSKKERHSRAGAAWWWLYRNMLKGPTWVLSYFLDRAMTMGLEVAMELWQALSGSPKTLWLQHSGPAGAELLQEVKEQSDRAWAYVIDRRVEAPEKFQAIQTYRATLALLSQQATFVEELMEDGVIEEKEAEDLDTAINRRRQEVERQGPVRRRPRLRQILTDSSLLRGMPPEIIKALRARASLKIFKKGERIFESSKEDPFSGGLVLVITGVARMIMEVDGQDLSVYLGSGAGVGALSCFIRAHVPGITPKACYAEADSLDRGPVVLLVPWSALQYILQQSRQYGVPAFRTADLMFMRRAAGLIVEAVRGSTMSDLSQHIQELLIHVLLEHHRIRTLQQPDATAGTTGTQQQERPSAEGVGAAALAVAGRTFRRTTSIAAGTGAALAAGAGRLQRSPTLPAAGVTGFGGKLQRMGTMVAGRLDAQLGVADCLTRLTSLLEVLDIPGSAVAEQLLGMDLDQAVAVVDDHEFVPLEYMDLKELVARQITSAVHAVHEHLMRQLDEGRLLILAPGQPFMQGCTAVLIQGSLVPASAGQPAAAVDASGEEGENVRQADSVGQGPAELVPHSAIFGAGLEGEEVMVQEAPAVMLWSPDFIPYVVSGQLSHPAELVAGPRGAEILVLGPQAGALQQL